MTTTYHSFNLETFVTTSSAFSEGIPSTATHNVYNIMDWLPVIDIACRCRAVSGLPRTLRNLFMLCLRLVERIRRGNHDCADREESRAGFRRYRQTSQLSNISEDDFIDAEAPYNLIGVRKVGHVVAFVAVTTIPNSEARQWKGWLLRTKN
jgi:hypothetical protein